jgi:hypothetical protein
MFNFDHNNNSFGSSKECLENIEHPFTELLSLLRYYRISSPGHFELIYSTKALKAISQHTDNSIQLLLDGLQALGYILGKNQEEQTLQSSVSSLGFLIQTMGNLIEALYVLRADISYEIKQRQNTKKIPLTNT